MLMQLRYTGVLETTRIRRDGYAVRIALADFLNKCRCVWTGRCSPAPRYHFLALKYAQYTAIMEDATPENLRAGALTASALALSTNAAAGCQRILKTTRLTGAQVGINLVFLKVCTLRRDPRLKRCAAVLSLRHAVAALDDHERLCHAHHQDCAEVSGCAQGTGPLTCRSTVAHSACPSSRC